MTSGKPEPPSNPPGPVPTDAAPAAPTSVDARRKPFKGGHRTAKSDRKQMRERVLMVAQLLARRLHRHEIKKVMRGKFGVGGRQTETYISRARELLIDRTGRSRDDHFSEAFCFYEGVLRDPGADIKDKFAAQAELNKLLGLYAPFKVAPTNIAGTAPAEIVTRAVKDLSTEELEVLSKLRQRMTALVASDQAEAEKN